MPKGNLITVDANEAAASVAFTASRLQGNSSDVSGTV